MTRASTVWIAIAGMIAKLDQLGISRPPRLLSRVRTARTSANRNQLSPERPWISGRYCSSIWILIHSVFTRFLANWTISRALESRSRPSRFDARHPPA